MGNIRRKPSGRYEARYRDAANRLRGRTFATKSEARRFLERVGADIQRGEWRDPRLGRILFRDWALHVESIRLNRRPSTRARDATLVRTRILPTFGDCQLAAITTVDVKVWVASLEADGLAPTTIRKCYQLLANAMSEAEDAGLIVRTPCRKVRLPTDERDAPVLLTPRDVQRLAEVVPSRYRGLVLTAAYTGLRWGELCGLRVPRVDLLRRRIDVIDVLIEVDGELSFGPPKTRRSRARVSFPPFLADVLGAHIGAFPDPDPSRQLVFTSDDSAPLRRSNFRRRVWVPAVEEAGLPLETTFHALRHACASWLIEAGANPLEVAEKLRHTKITTTLSVYGHLFPGTDDRLDTALQEAHNLGESTETPARIPRARPA